MLDKKQIQVILLFKFKMRCEAVGKYNINNAFGPGTANKHTVLWWFKKFCKGDKSLEDAEHSCRPLEVDSNQLRAMIKADPLITTQQVAEEFHTDHSTVAWHLNQIGKVKKLDKRVPHELTANQKILILKCHLLLFYAAMNHFLIGLKCNENFIWQPPTTSSVVRLRRSSEVLLRAKLAPKKGPDHCLVVCCWSDPLQLSESPWNHYIWEVCSANQPMRCAKNAKACSRHESTERAQLLSTTTPNYTSYNQHSKSWINLVTKFCLIHHIHLTSCQLTTTSSSILTAFCRENASITSRRQKTLSKNSSNLKAWICMLQQ